MDNMNNMNINSAIADTMDIGNTNTEKKTGLIGFYNYTVVLTYIGMWIGFCLDENLRGVILMKRWHSLKWKGKSFAQK